MNSTMKEKLTVALNSAPQGSDLNKAARTREIIQQIEARIAQTKREEREARFKAQAAAALTPATPEVTPTPETPVATSEPTGLSIAQALLILDSVELPSE